LVSDLQSHPECPQIWEDASSTHATKVCVLWFFFK
jgi:hypothetical protein